MNVTVTELGADAHANGVSYFYECAPALFIDKISTYALASSFEAYWSNAEAGMPT